MPKIQHVTRILLLVITAVGLVACNSGHFEDPESQYIGKYKSPFADKKVHLAIPDSKVVNKKINSKVAFNPETDSIPASIMINMNCAREACDQSSRNDIGRITCAGYKKAVEQNWPPAVNRFSFSYIFEPGETPELIATALEADPVDKSCVVGISNYAEMRYNRTDDPDIQMTKPAYAQSPYLDQIDYFSAQNFIGGISAQPKIGIIDADFFLGNADIPASKYVTDISSYGGKKYPVEGEKIINVGGAPLAKNSKGHGNLVSELIMGTGNNATQGIGVASQIGYSFSPQLVAANVKALDEESGVSYISVDNVNNALALMAYMKVDVINMSLGVRMEAANPPMTMQAAILAAIGQGSVVVVAAGNDAFNMTLRKNSDGTNSKYQAYPAAWGVDYYGLITVAALNSDATDLVSFSNFGADKVDIAAPGTNMTIAGNDYQSGTSFAAPLVTGAVAIISGYYKSKNIQVIPAQIELALLAAGKNLPALNARVKNGLSLHIPTVVTQLTTKSVSQVPSAILDNDGFWYTRDGTSMTYSIRTVGRNIDEADTSLHIGIWEKFDMSLPPLAEMPAQNGQSNFELPFYNFVVGDEGFWVVLYRSTTENGKEVRIAISSKLYKFTDLIKTPTQDESNILGAINEVNTSVNGWACLSGRPDHLIIDVRVGSPSGPLLNIANKAITTQVQPKGREYFDQCTPFTVMLGFNIPLRSLAPNTDYYFVVRHPTQPNKNKVLNAQPFRIEVHQDTAPVVYNLKKSITTDKISVKGSICWENQTEPGIISYYPVAHLYESSNTFRDWFFQTILPSQPQLNALYVDKKLQVTSSVRPLDFRTISFETAPNTLSAYTTYDVTGNGWGPSSPSYIAKGDIVAAGTGPSMLFLKKNDFVPPQPDYAFGCCGALGIMTVGSAWSKVDGSKIWFVDTNQSFPDSAIAKFSNPLVADDSMITLSNSTTICSANKKIGVGQDFTITMSKATLANHFNIGDNIVMTDGSDPQAPYTIEQLRGFNNQLNVSYKASLYSGIKGLVNTILTKGDFELVLKGFTHSSGSTTQQFNVSDLVNY
jgi:hypothetical protein